MGLNLKDKPMTRNRWTKTKLENKEYQGKIKENMAEGSDGAHGESSNEKKTSQGSKAFKKKDPKVVMWTRRL